MTEKREKLDDWKEWRKFSIYFVNPQSWLDNACSYLGKP